VPDPRSKATRQGVPQCWVLILLRHGRTPHNAEARLQGVVDPSLDEVGVGQAQAAGEYIRQRWDIKAVVRSSLVRATETTEHAGFGDHDVVVDDRWREIDFGNYELTAHWRSDIDFEPPGGESMARLHERVMQACVDLADQAADEDVLVVTHATPIKSAVVWALGGPPSMILNLWLGLATVTVLNQVHGEFILAEYNVPPNP